MAELKNEIVKISLPPRPEQADAPKNETARISILPRLATIVPAINATQPGPVITTSHPVAPIDPIPRPLCWALLGISALIFLIQIWNYVVS